MKIYSVGKGKVNEKVEPLYTKSQVVEMLGGVVADKKKVAHAFYDGGMEDAGDRWLDEALAIERLMLNIDAYLG